MELLERVGLPTRVRQALPGAALRRPAATGRRRPRAGRRPARDADGRAVQRRRPGRPRASCRTSSCGCRSELGKTIVFVTHDIDEAIKLGDQVAVLRVGGKLAQLASPAELLEPSGRRFRGRLRRPRPRLPRARLRGRRPAAHPRASRRSGSATPRRRAPIGARTAGCWSSTTTGEPQGWLAGPGGRRRAAAPPRCCCTAAEPLAQQGGSLRAALDAALSSPTGRGVVVDEEGRLRRLDHGRARCWS